MPKATFTFSLLAFLFIFNSLQSSAQITQPYTLTFSSNSAAAWADGIAQDGDGGSTGMTGIHLQIYAADATNFAVFPGSTMNWFDNSYYFSGNSDFTGLTPGPDPGMSSNGVPAMVIKSTNQSFNFSLTNIRLYDWGGTATTKITTYNNGVLVGSINVTFDQSGWTTKTLTPATGLTASVFQNIDEIRFTPVSASRFWLSMNDIGLSNLGVLPLKLTSFETLRQPNSSALLKWTTEQESNVASFDIEHSTDGMNFSLLGKVQANSNHVSAGNYSFTTGIQPEGKHFYRLKIINADGSFSYSKINTLLFSTAVAINIYPNPVKDIARIYASGEKIQQVVVYNAAGSRLKTQHINSTNATIDLSKLASGTYYIEVFTDKKTYKESVIKK